MTASFSQKKKQEPTMHINKYVRTFEILWHTLLLHCCSLVLGPGYLIASRIPRGLSNLMFFLYSTCIK